MWHRALLAALSIVVACSAAAAAPATRVYSDAGNIFIENNGARTKLTSSEQDIDPVLAPSGTFVVFTRQGRGRSARAYSLGQPCMTSPKPDELRQVNVDGSGDRLLLSGRKGEPQEQLCDFRSKQFNSDGQRLYFLTPGWMTLAALHVYDMRAREDHFVLPATDLLVLSFCANKYKDDLAVRSRRDFLFGGSYDWYWLYDATGKKELGPIGPFDNPDDIVKLAHDEWCKP
mgnify:CR=1 FL=1